MTTVVCFKVPDGIVLGADSAMTVHRQAHGDNRYDSYHKLSRVGCLPVATAMWGRGSIGQRSIPSLVEELSVSHIAREPAEAWDVERVARALYALLVQRHESSPHNAETAALHMLVAGYSPGSYHGQVWRLQVPDGEPRLIASEETLTISWFGVTDAIHTLWWGHSPHLPQVLEEQGLEAAEIQRVIQGLRRRAAWGPERLDFGMPLQNAVDLVAFLMSVEISHERYSPGLARSAPPVDLLVVRSGGAQWVRRKELFAPPAPVGGLLP
jgi:hypothetical protein